MPAKKWFFENLRDEALKFKDKTEFRKGNQAAHCAAKARDDYALICAHMPERVDKSGDKSPHQKWNREKIKNTALQYDNKPDFEKGCPGALQAAHRMGITEEVCSHMIETYITWTPELIISSAKKFNTREEFRQGNNPAYQAARTRGLLDLICLNMKPSRTEAYSVEELKIEAKKHKTYIQFKDDNEAAYKAAIKHEDKDLICANLRPSRGSSVAEKELFSIIKVVSPNIKKYKDMKVKIEGKPYIHGFEIDMLIGKLGIEFDGTYYHSFKQMRKNKSKRLWSDEDIRRYHDLKDEWFATKGIKILHIKEEEWIFDKEACIQKCLIFLGLISINSESIPLVSAAA